MRRFLVKTAADRVVLLCKLAANPRGFESWRRVRSVSSSSFRSQTSKALAQVAAEQEWLQESSVTNTTSSETLDALSSPRFDWRRCATSRTRVLANDDQYSLPWKRLIQRVQPPFVEVQEGELFYDEIQAYQERFLSLLAAEQAEEEAVLKERLSTWSLARLQAEGYCLTQLSAFWLQANQFGRPVAVFLLGPGRALPDHRFENGIQVLVSRLDPLQEPPILGTVVARSATQIKVSFQQSLDLDHGTWRMDVGISDISYNRMRTAISHLNHDPHQQECAPNPADHQIILQGTYLRDVLLRTFSKSSPSIHRPLQLAEDVSYPAREALEHRSRMVGDNTGAFRDDMRIMSWARRYREIGPVRVEGDPILSGLNCTQIRAIAMMIGERVSLVQGPPGTGKTKTIVQAVKILKVHFRVHQPILVCTYTNAAVDNLVEAFSLAGVHPLRVGYGGKVKPSLLEHTLDYKLEKHPFRPEVDELSKMEESLQKRANSLRVKVEDLTKGDVQRNTDRLKRTKLTLVHIEKQQVSLRSKLYAMRQKMLRQIVAEADVICTTCITSACVALSIADFPVVFLDEASMSTEPASLIPLMKGSRHLALIGDHKQLPPVIASREAKEMGLGISLFERLTEEGVVPSIMLNVQYRMHPALSRFPSAEFYNLSLQDGTIDLVGKISSGLEPPVSRHLILNSVTGSQPSIVFLDHPGSESPKDRSRVNYSEAHILCNVVEDLLLSNQHLRGQDIGIIAPYTAQVSLITRLLNTDAKYQERFRTTLGDHRSMQIAHIDIKTVDGFEGREKEVIIFSTVRNNPRGYIGFLADRRRLNVGLTRAKRGLFMLGSINTLMAGKQSASLVGAGAESWRRYVQFLSREGLVLRRPEEHSVMNYNGSERQDTAAGRATNPIFGTCRSLQGRPSRIIGRLGSATLTWSECFV